ncbi:unnamed protein product [Arabidopsis halleri]
MAKSHVQLLLLLLMPLFFSSALAGTLFYNCSSKYRFVIVNFLFFKIYVSYC